MQGTWSTGVREPALPANELSPKASSRCGVIATLPANDGVRSPFIERKESLNAQRTAQGATLTAHKDFSRWQHALYCLALSRI